MARDPRRKGIPQPPPETRPMTRNDLIVAGVVVLITLLPIPVMAYLGTDPPYYIPIHDPGIGIDVRVPPNTRPTTRGIICPFWVPKMRVDPLRWRHPRARKYDHTPEVYGFP